MTSRMAVLAVAAIAASAGSSNAQPQIAGCPVFPANNVWNTPVDTVPAAPDSQILIRSMEPSLPLYPDFGAGTHREGITRGIPYVVTDGKTRKLRIDFEYAAESDPGPYPIPADAPIEGGAASRGDRHILVIDRDQCRLYEIYAAYPLPKGGWKAGAGAIFDLRANKLRPQGWTSADAAGLPILPGLVRYEEVMAGEIAHALRFTVVKTRNDFVWPARHLASKERDLQFPRMGQRLRLKRDVNIEGFSPEVTVILRALKKYGMILADNGPPWDITGTPDERWNNEHLKELGRIHGSDFEVVDSARMMVQPHSAEARQDGR